MGRHTRFFVSKTADPQDKPTPKAHTRSRLELFDSSLLSLETIVSGMEAEDVFPYSPNEYGTLSGSIFSLFLIF